ncbi:MAG TPA: 3-oxoacyl-ACP reductase FabG [Candidatus Fraserbacteria bacterium]|nr:3-oxoacyl-ACP reductase FabG [Candidatus Fraserbacteria bacterium]
MGTELSGKVAFITGAGSGIGRAIAHELADHGADVAVNDISPERAELVSKEIVVQGRRAIAAVADISDFEQVQRAVQVASDELGPIDILVNNAGWDTLKPFLQGTLAEYNKIIDINFRGPIFVTRAVAEGMSQRKSGVIISIASDAGRVGSLGEAVYSGCKGGIIAISKSWARELARDHIRVNVICPGLIDTPLLHNLQENDFGRKVIGAITRQIPFGLGRPEQIADAVLFFASPASEYITGQVLSVSGGLTYQG